MFDACRSGNESLVKYLIEHGADIDKENKDEETPLDLAYDLGYGNIIRYLEGKGAVRTAILLGIYEQSSGNSDDSWEVSESSGDESDVTLD